MSAVNGLSGSLGYLGNAYQASNSARAKSGQTDGTDANTASASLSSAPVTVTETYAPTVTSANGQTRAPVVVTEVYSPSASASQKQSDMLQALVDSQSRTGTAQVYGGDTDSNDGQYAVVAVGVYSENAGASEPAPAMQQVSAWS